MDKGKTSREFVNGQVCVGKSEESEATQREPRTREKRKIEREGKWLIVGHALLLTSGNITQRDLVHALPGVEFIEIFLELGQAKEGFAANAAAASPREQIIQQKHAKHEAADTLHPCWPEF